MGSDLEIMHSLTSCSEGVYTSGCDLSIKSKGKPPELAGWSSQVTCALCWTRLTVHRKVTNWREVALLIDIDDRTLFKRFNFTGKKWGFRWHIGYPLVYVYETPDAFTARSAFPIGNFVPESFCEPITFEMAGRATKLWVNDHEARFGIYNATTSVTRTPVVRTPPTQPHCAKCWKIDEGDCVVHPSDPTKLLCMSDFIKAFRDK